MLESSDFSFEQKRSDASDLSFESIGAHGYSCAVPELEEVPFMQKSLPNFNEVYDVIQKKGQCMISGFKRLEDVSDALKRYGDVRAYHASNQDPAILAGGKILGAGGGGFLLFFAPPEAHATIRGALSKLIEVPFEFDFSGSQVVLYNPNLQINRRNVIPFRRTGT
jgi:hypothetical protein